MPNPPDQWTAFSTRDMTDPSQFAQALSDAYAQGYTGTPLTVPSPVVGDIATWVAIPGYEH